MLPVEYWTVQNSTIQYRRESLTVGKCNLVAKKFAKVSQINKMTNIFFNKLSRILRVELYGEQYRPPASRCWIYEGLMAMLIILITLITQLIARSEQFVYVCWRQRRWSLSLRGVVRGEDTGLGNDVWECSSDQTFTHWVIRTSTVGSLVNTREGFRREHNSYIIDLMEVIKSKYGFMTSFITRTSPVFSF